MTGRRVPGRAHTPEEKRAIVDRIFVAWTTGKATHLRLGQLLVNANGSDLFNIEDNQMADAVEELVAKR